MASITLYPELIEYIYRYCDEFKTKDEILGARSAFHFGGDLKGRKRDILIGAGLYSDAEHIKQMVADGLEQFKIKVAERIVRDHRDQLNLNLCPKCGKIARTPLAKQCRFCFHNWH